MEYPSVLPETALQVAQALLYYMAYVLITAVAIGLAVYLFLVGSEMLLEPRLRARRASAGQSARVPGMLKVSAAENSILAGTENLEDGAVRGNGSPHDSRVPARATEPTRNLTPSHPFPGREGGTANLVRAPLIDAQNPSHSFPVAFLD